MKPEIISDIVQKTGEALKVKLATLGFDSPEAVKKTVLAMVSDELGVQLKELQPTISKAVLQQIPAGAMFSPDRGRSFDPAIGLSSLPEARLEELKKKMLFMISSPDMREYMDSQFALSTGDRKGYFQGASAKDLQIQVGASGGFLVPQEFLGEVQRKLVKISTFRSQAKFYNGVGLKGSLPRETGTVSITYEGEMQTIPTTDFSLGEINWSLSKRTALTLLSRELWQFSAVDVLTLLSTMYAEQDQLKDDLIYMKGTGKNQPMGLSIERAGINTLAQAGVHLDWTDLIKLKHKLAVQYRNEGGLFMMTNNTLAVVATLKDDQNRPIFLDRGPAGIAGANVPPMTVGFIAGFPVMENNAGGVDTEIWFTNLKRGYVGFDGGTAETRTSEEAGNAFLKNQMYVRMIRYDDGKPNIPEANCVLTGVAA